MNAPSIGVFFPTIGDRNGLPGDIPAAARHAEELVDHPHRL
jgi:hypothetical protein